MPTLRPKRSIREPPDEELTAKRPSRTNVPSAKAKDNLLPIPTLKSKRARSNIRSRKVQNTPRRENSPCPAGNASRSAPQPLPPPQPSSPPPTSSPPTLLEALFDWVEVWRVRWKEFEYYSSPITSFFNLLPKGMVYRRVVQDDD
jgi:hypothetical protein